MHVLSTYLGLTAVGLLFHHGPVRGEHDQRSTSTSSGQLHGKITPTDLNDAGLKVIRDVSRRTRLRRLKDREVIRRDCRILQHDLGAAVTAAGGAGRWKRGPAYTTPVSISAMNIFPAAESVIRMNGEPGSAVAPL
nr:hypothetical protein CFP56_19255 [Quercus suber]